MQATNIFFSKLIKLEGRLREFNFRKIPQTENSFHVDVTDDRGQRIMFQMKKSETGEWQAPVDLLPNWINSAQTQLSLAINEQTSA